MSESGSGEPVDSSAANDKDSSVCPTCGDEFASSIAVKTHHYQAHGESIAGVDIVCEWCGETKTKRPSHVNEDGPDFCSKPCADSWLSEYKECKVEYECDYCESLFKIHPFRLEKSERHFCPDSNCYGAWQSENATGDNARHWKGGKRTVECANCGSKKQVKPYRLEKSEKFYCSGTCESEHKQTICGEEHPLYKPDKVRGYGPNWDEQKEKARERDNYTCQDCGVNESELPRALDVHHIRRLAWFKNEYDSPEWYELGNDLSNLTTLCRPCHHKWEGIPLKPDNRTNR